MLKKQSLYIFLIIVISFNSCKVLNNITSKTEKDNIEKTSIIETNDSLTIDNQIQDTFPQIVNIDSSFIEPTNDFIIDSMEIVKKILGDTITFAKVFKNRFSENESIYENTTMLKGSALLHQLDSLSKVKFYNKHEFSTDVSKLNKYNYSYNKVPEFTDSIYELRIEMLNINTPVELEYNEHVKAFINVYAKKGRKQTARMLGLKEIYFPLFEQVLDKYDLPLELKYLAVVESALNPTAGSHAGAKGLWQFMYGTGKNYGLKANSLVDDRFDPYKATEAAVLHMKDLYAIYGNWELVLAAYNSGPGNVNRAIRRSGGVKDYWAIWPFLPRETRGYVPAFIAVNYVFNYNIEHNIYPTNPGILYYGIDSVSVADVLSFDQISEFLNIDKEDIDFLNPAYKKGIIPATKDNHYILRLPRDKIGYFIDNEQALYDFKSKDGIEREKLLVQIKKAKERSFHFVRSGENLGVIARKYNTSVRTLKSWNGMRNTRIYPGQKLIVYHGKSNRKTNKPIKRNTKKTGIYHKVRSGETLGQIAEQNGITVKQIKSWNGLRNNMIKPGQSLKVSSKSKRTKKKTIESKQTKVFKGKYRYHIIEKGDTLWALARKYNSSVEDIRQWNDISNSHRLKLGEKLIVGQKS